MDTKLLIVVLASVTLGAIIVVTGCVKVLGKDGKLDMKSGLFMFVGFVFVALPFATTLNIEWGDFKLFVNTTNKEVQALQKSLDSLLVVNTGLQNELATLQTNVTHYGRVMSDVHSSPLLKSQASLAIDNGFRQMNTKIIGLSTGIESTRRRTDITRANVAGFKTRSWFKK